MAEPQADPWSEFPVIAAPAHDPWAAFPRVQPGIGTTEVGAPRELSAGEVAADVAKSAAIGVPKGVINTVGQFGDTADLASQFATWISGKLFGEDAAANVERALKARAVGPSLGSVAAQVAGASPETVQKVQGLTAGPSSTFGPAPTSGEIQHAVETVTGPLYQPKSTPGKYAQNITELAPVAAAAGPSGVVGNTIKGAVLPGIGSEYLGEKVAGTGLEPVARAVGGAAGGVAGMGLGRGSEALANRGAARTAAGELGGAANPAAVRLVGQSYAADDLSPAAVAARQAELGPEAMALDMGRQMQARAEGTAQPLGRAQNTIMNAVEGRVGQFGGVAAGRIRADLDQHMGANPDLVAARNHINDVVDRQARPLYDAVMGAHPIVDVPAPITTRPVVAQAMRDAETLARNYGEQLSHTETRTVLNAGGVPVEQTVQIPAQPSLRYWDYVKKAMDARINGMLRGGGIQDLNSAEKADLGGLQDARRALVNHLDQVTDDAYRTARQVSATKFQVNEAIDLGRGALNRGLLPEELAEQMQGMSVPEQAGVRIGMRREIERIMDTARNDGAAARRLLDTNHARDKIATVFSPDVAAALDRRIAAEQQFQNAAGNITGNSRTSMRTQAAKDVENPSVAQPPTANLAGLALAGLRRGREYLGDMSMDRTRQGVADLVTRGGGDLTELARILSGYNARRAANAGPGVGPQARSLAAILASQAPAQISDVVNDRRR